MVRKRDLDYLIIAAMLLTGLYMAATGLVMDWFGLHQLAYHNYVGYAWAALAALHVTLNWGRITAYLRRRFRPKPERDPPAREEVKTPRLGRRQLLATLLGLVAGFVLGKVVPGQRAAQLTKETEMTYQDDIGAYYHQWSKPGYSLTRGVLSDWGGQPERHKSYPDAQRVDLPDPHGYRGMSLEEVIENRRSIREYAGEPLSLEEFSRLMHAAQGITDQRRGFRAAPSAGALYPIETYIVVHDVAGLEPGLYHYAVVDHTLERLRTDNLRGAIMVAGIGQEMLGQAQVCFVLSAMFQRLRWKYRERTYRYALLEAGHIGQNIYLAATSMGLGACAVGAFLDDELNDLLGLDGQEEAALYLISVGQNNRG
jgi:SagB-type dehydrogenase family enzyme